MTMREVDTPDDDIASCIADDGDFVTSTISVAGSSKDCCPFVRHGIDLVSIERMSSLLAEFGESFRDRVFTRSEQTYCESQGTPSQHYAARWAAKEAFYKTLDTESPAVPLDSIEVVREPTGPRLRLEPPATDAFGEMLERQNMCTETASIGISLSHDKDAGYAIGSVTVFSIDPQFDTCER